MTQMKTNKNDMAAVLITLGSVIAVVILAYLSLTGYFTPAAQYEFQALLKDDSTILKFHESGACDKYKQSTQNIQGYAYEIKCGYQEGEWGEPTGHDFGCYYKNFDLNETKCILGISFDCWRGDCFK